MTMCSLKLLVTELENPTIRGIFLYRVNTLETSLFSYTRNLYPLMTSGNNGWCPYTSIERQEWLLSYRSSILSSWGHSTLRVGRNPYRILNVQRGDKNAPSLSS